MKKTGGTRTPVTESMTATEAQNSFGRVLQKAAAGRTVFITRYDQPEAVVISAEAYRNLKAGSSPDLTGLTADFDKLVSNMQRPAQKAAADALFQMGDTGSRSRRRKKRT